MNAWIQSQGFALRERAAAAPLALGQVEVKLVLRYTIVVLLAGGIGTAWAWSRISLREATLALDTAERARSVAAGENARLRLELATLQDPAWLDGARAGLGLTADVRVVDLPEEHTP